MLDVPISVSSIYNTYPIRLQIIEKHFRGSKRIILQLTMVYVKTIRIRAFLNSK